MSDLLSDFLNDRLQPVETGGLVNGVMDYKLSDDEAEYSESEPESDTEQKEYVKKEIESYSMAAEETGGLCDIDDGHEESILGSDICEMIGVPKVFDNYKFDAYFKKELPIDSFREKILALINTNSVVVIHGPTGCGKTTQVPQYILDQCKANKAPCNIIVTQPRRIAAINIAQRVCEERGWVIGTVCGYQVGLERNAGEDVILTYVTTEVLLQKLIVQKNLNRYTHIVIDEVHERNKSLDFLLLLVRKYLFTNSPSVKIILMSATMEAQEFAYYFRSIPRNIHQQYLLAPILNVNKKSEFSTMVYYNEQFDKRISEPLPPYNIDEPFISPQQYKLCLSLITFFDTIEEKETDRLTKNEPVVGSVLVFLPGLHEIEEMNKLLMENRTSKFGWEIIPLHSSLTNDSMFKAFQKPKQGIRKIILSTNIAESSLTVPDVNYVIDFCLTKIMVVNEMTKFSTLSLQWASHNNCMQRAGRVGRVANGRVYRLVPHDFYQNQMQPNTLPELQRAPLENIILYMKLLDLNDTPKNVLSLAISPPNLKDVESCIWHLKEVGALLQTCRGKKNAADGDITFLGRIMGSLPIDIHMSKLIILGHMFSCLDETVIMAAGCMTRKLFINNFHDRFKCYRKKLLWSDGSLSDFIALLNLYNVWLKSKRENAFRSSHEEYAWCKTNYVNLKGLREWDILIKEINSRLKRFGIEKPMGVTRVHMSPTDKPLILKVIICGAFYPHYFVRSSEYGQVDAKEAVRILSGRDPRNTVYFTNMKLNQPGRIYVRQIKKLLECENNPNVHVGFDSQSTKVFVEFKNVKQPEQVTVEGQQYITTIPSNIAMDVLESVRRRQLNMPFRLEILPDHEAWEFANSTEAKLKRLNSASSDEVNCFSSINYSPLPTLDMEYMSVTVTHVEDAGHFYCQNWNEETRAHLQKIYAALNGPGVFLEPVEGKVEICSKIYAAMFQQDGKYYRCKVLCINPGHEAQVQFIDYGNVQRVYLNRLCHLPDNEECHIHAIAICCVLSEVKPCMVLNPTALWPERVNNILRKKTDGILLNAKVYSVVHDVVYLELYFQNLGPTGVSFNQWLINEGFGQKCEESYLSKMDHEKRLQVLASENPSKVSSLYSDSSTPTSYTDFEAPIFSDPPEIVQLRGPFSPLEMKVGGLVRASWASTVQVDGDSINAVLLDDCPEDSHARLLVAGQVAQSAVNKTIKISQTTIMPSIPGLPMLMTLLFCPKMEPKPTPDGFRIASILAGLGCKELCQKSNYPMHDISLVLDTELNADVIVKVNEIRYYMNKAIKTMSNIYDELAFPDELFSTQKELKELLLALLPMRQKSVDRINTKYADVWDKTVCNDLEILKMDHRDEDDDIWPLHWFFRLNNDKYARVSVNKNLEELTQIAKRLAPERQIVCELCKSDTLYSISDVRIHLFREQHKNKLIQYQKDSKLKERE